MAATACAYGYQGTAARPPPARSSQVPADPFLTFDDDAEAATPPPPPPPPPRPLPPSFWSRHLGICTEGLGSESSGDIDLSDLSDDVNNNGDGDSGAVDAGHQALPCKRHHRDDGEPGRARSATRPAFPPPISVIGAGGKPWLYLRHHREDGRLVLREVRIPSRELLQARREDGRFKLQFAQPQPAEEEPEDDVDHHQCQDPESPADATVPEKKQDVNE
ncbi:hypothetical protein BAE44_0026180 [Dichanthelium oligosanthes]|uniref:FAF domain-containing protein n=1 Tax=Dichanthelium oligosanthes TaxID=888268 RepID=A0A1E5UIT8_9POAL|nr:hypothetical protein BAE44_0026180 [Dichanthelium oligosanthes]